MEETQKPLEILVVEDKYTATAKAALDEFEKTGDARFTYVSDYDSALKALNSRHFDGCISDVFFPEETGTGKRKAVSKVYYRLWDWKQTGLGLLDFLSQKENCNLRDLEKGVDEARAKNQIFFPKPPYSERLGPDTYGSDRSMEYVFQIGNLNSAIEADEANQPLGVLVLEELIKKEIPFVIATDVGHHSKAGGGLVCYYLENEFSLRELDLHNHYYVDNRCKEFRSIEKGRSIKEDAEYWNQAYLKLFPERFTNYLRETGRDFSSYRKKFEIKGGV